MKPGRLQPFGELRRRSGVINAPIVELTDTSPYPCAIIT